MRKLCELELGNENFAKRLEWSPDERFILANCEDNKVRVYSFNNEQITKDPITIPIADTIQDICWYPWVNKDIPGSECFLTFSKDQPIQLWDVLTTKVRCQYKAMDHLDQLSTCYSGCFDPTGRYIIAGTRSLICLFDASIPGNSINTVDGNLKGPISTISCRQDDSGVFAAGTFGGDLALFDLRQGPQKLLSLDGHKEGLTQVQFGSDGWSLFSVARKENNIKRWDIRSGEVTLSYDGRNSNTNQRIYFDIFEDQLFSGDQDGNLLGWNINDGHLRSHLSIAPTTISSVSISCNYLTVSYGTRDFTLHLTDSDSDLDERKISKRPVAIPSCGLALYIKEG